MGCFVFIMMITLAVATTNPMEDIPYGEIVNNFNSLKEEKEQLQEEITILHGKYNIIHEKNKKLQEEIVRHQKIKNKLKAKLRNSKNYATIRNNALQSSKERLEKELKERNEELKISQQELQSAKSCGNSTTMPPTEAPTTPSTQPPTTYVPPTEHPVNMKDCTELYSNGFTLDGVYTIQPENSEPLSVYCQEGWTVIQKRSDDSVNYTKNMEEYGRGFGQIDGEHWLGLNAMNKLTEQGSYTLRFELEAFDGETAWAEYTNFHISAATDYTLSFDKRSYRGTAGDSFFYNHNRKFTTYDMDRDAWVFNSCSTDFGGKGFGGSGWWFYSCSYATTTGMKYRRGFSIYWNDFKDSAVLKAAVMKIKRV